MASAAAAVPAPGDSGGGGGGGHPDPDQHDRMKNAVAFLQHPKVVAAPLQQKLSFLEKKGLSKDEICRAFRQINPNSPDAAAIEKGATMTATSEAPTTSAPAPIYPAQATPMVYYAYPPQAYPPSSSSRLPLYSALASALLAAGGGLAYVYRYAIAAKIMSSREATPPPPPPPDADSLLRDRLLETARTNQALLASLQKSSDNVAELLAKLVSKIDQPPPPPPPPKAPISDRPDTLSPAVQALLEGTPSSPAVPSTTFDLATATATLDRALSELERCAEAAPAISVLRLYIKNLVETGSESTRFHRISFASPTYEQKVAPYPSAVDLLKAVGFRRSDGFLVWQAPLGEPSSADSLGRKQILTIALERLGELMEKATEPSRDDDAAA